jgi:hypothetical protein
MLRTHPASGALTSTNLVGHPQKQKPLRGYTLPSLGDRQCPSRRY